MFCPCRFPSLFSPSRKNVPQGRGGLLPRWPAFPSRQRSAWACGIDTAGGTGYSPAAYIMISFTNISGAEEIGANCYLLEMDGTRIVLDSGMHPKKEGKAAMPDFDSLEPNSVEAVF